MCVGGGGGGGEGGEGAWVLGWALVEEELRVSDNIMGLFSLSYCCFSYGTRIFFFLYIAICHICIIFLNMLSLIFFAINIENVGECCKAQWFCVDQGIALYERYLSLLCIIVTAGIVTTKKTETPWQSYSKKVKRESEMGGRGGRGKNSKKGRGYKQKANSWQWRRNVILWDSHWKVC